MQTKWCFNIFVESERACAFFSTLNSCTLLGSCACWQQVMIKVAVISVKEMSVKDDEEEKCLCLSKMHTFVNIC